MKKIDPEERVIAFFVGCTPQQFNALRDKIALIERVRDLQGARSAKWCASVDLPPPPKRGRPRKVAAVTPPAYDTKVTG